MVQTTFVQWYKKIMQDRILESKHKSKADFNDDDSPVPEAIVALSHKLLGQALNITMKNSFNQNLIMMDVDVLVLTDREIGDLSKVLKDGFMKATL